MDLIKIYINNLTKNDAKTFIQNRNIELTENEFDFLFKEIKENYIKIIDEDENEIDLIKSRINKNSFDKLMLLFKKYKKYLQ